MSGAAEAVANRAASAALALGVRQLGVYPLNIIGSVLLARLLDPTSFGFLAVGLFVLTFITTFGSAGLGTSLVRNRGEPTLVERRTAFTLQLVLVGAIALGLAAFAEPIAQIYKLSAYGPMLLIGLAVAVVLQVGQLIPIVDLERRLDFGAIARMEIAQAVIYNVVAVGLAAAGWGAASIATAILARVAGGVVLAYVISPWPIGLAFDWDVIRRHAGFGLPYQAAAMVSVVKDSITPLMIGVTLGSSAVGSVFWAQTVANYPVVILFVLQRLYLPAFARMNDHPDALPRFVEKVILATNAVAAPLAMLTLVLAEPITRNVFGEQWLPALPLFVGLWFANLFVATVTPLLGLLNARGRSRTVLGFALAWMLATWGIGAPLIALFGTGGYVVTNMVVQLISLALFRVARQEVPFRLMRSVAPPWVAAAVSAAPAAIAAIAFPTMSLPAVLVLVTGGLAFYGLMMAATHRDEVRALRSWISSSRANT